MSYIKTLLEGLNANASKEDAHIWHDGFQAGLDTARAHVDAQHAVWDISGVQASIVLNQINFGLLGCKELVENKFKTMKFK